MPSVKIKKHAPDNDMTPFVDIAFLILSFFMLATKFKPEEPVEVTTPNSVSSTALPEKDAFMVSIDKDGRVFISFGLWAVTRPGPSRQFLSERWRELGRTARTPWSS